MITPELIRYKQKIDGLFEKTKAYSNDPELQSHWARYLCILISGLLENAVRITLVQHVSQRSHPRVSNYVSSQLDRFSSAKMGNIIQLYGLFDSQWREDLDLETADKLKASVDSVVATRHQIAHGKDVGISYHQLRSYYIDIIEVIDLLEKKCL